MLRMLTSFMIVVLLVPGTILLLAGQEHQQMKMEGIWQGVLEVTGMELRIVFKISKDSTDSWIGTMDSPDQGAANIPIGEVVVKGDSLILRLPNIGGRFEGILNPDSLVLNGQWMQSGYTFPLVLKHSDEVPEIKRPQEPKKPYP